MQIAPGVLIFFEALGRSILLAVQCSKYRVAIGQVHNAWLDHVPRLKKWQGNLRRPRLITLGLCLLKAQSFKGHELGPAIHGRHMLLIAQLRNLVSSPLQILLCCLAVDELRSCRVAVNMPKINVFQMISSWQQLTSTEHFALTRLE